MVLLSFLRIHSVLFGIKNPHFTLVHMVYEDCCKPDNALKRNYRGRKKRSKMYILRRGRWNLQLESDITNPRYNDSLARTNLPNFSNETLMSTMYFQKLRFEISNITEKKFPLVKYILSSFSRGLAVSTALFTFCSDNRWKVSFNI